MRSELNAQVRIDEAAHGTVQRHVDVRVRENVGVLWSERVEDVRRANGDLRTLKVPPPTRGRLAKGERDRGVERIEAVGARLVFRVPHCRDTPPPEVRPDGPEAVIKTRVRLPARDGAVEHRR